MLSFSSLDTGSIIYLFVLAGILGAVFGSAMMCQGNRIASGENWWKGRSHCDACGHVLTAMDLIPVFSYLIQGGKCRYCGTKLSPKYLITEILMACAFMGILWHQWSLSWEVIMQWGLVCALLGLSVVDFDTYEIPDTYIIFGIVWWVLGVGMEYFAGMDVSYRIKGGLLGGVCIATGLFILSLLMDHILKKESMGGGDIKLVFVTGLYLGALNGLFSLVLACVIGLMFVVFLKKDKIPFGPSISIATYLGLTIVPYIVIWYVGLLR